MSEGRPAASPEGLLLIDKPKGITSHDAVDTVRRALGTQPVALPGHDFVVQFLLRA